MGHVSELMGRRGQVSKVTIEPSVSAHNSKCAFLQCISTGSV